MATIEKSVEVNVPVRAAYDQWTQFEEFPQFMDGVMRVEQLDDQRLRWEASIGGQHREWYAKITEQEPDMRIAWRGEGETANGGVVTFHKITPDTTKVMLQMEYDPDDVVEHVGDKLGFVSRRVEGDLKRFKEFIEERGGPTGGWRGRIKQDHS